MKSIKPDKMPRKFREGYLRDLDQRKPIAKAMRARYELFTNDLGGDHRLSYAQKSLVERSLFLEHHLSTLEKTLITGGLLDIGQYVQTVNSLQGIYSKLGLKKKMVDVDLGDYMEAKSNRGRPRGRDEEL